MHGTQLWVTDGTAANTKMVTSFTGQEYAGNPRVFDLTPAGDGFGALDFSPTMAPTGSNSGK